MDEHELSTKPKYIDPKTDFGFKYIFGREQSMPFLIDFLNNLLKDEPGFEPIVELTYLDKEKSKRSREERGVIYDVHCRTSNGKQFTVEMQNGEQAYYIDRMVYYGSKAIVDQGKSGYGWKYDYCPVYVISLMNFRSSQFEPKFRTDAALCDIRSHKQISDKQRYIFIQLPLFEKLNPEECGDDMERWFYVFINMSKMEAMPFTRENEIFEKLDSAASYASLSEDERRAYDADVKAYRDYVGQLSWAEEQGLKKGLEKGLNQVAKSLKAMGIDIQTISKSTGLSVASINKL